MHEHDEPVGRPGVRRSEAFAIERDVAAGDADAHVEVEVGALVAQPVADQPVDRGPHEPAARGRLDVGAETGSARRAQPGGAGPEADPDAAVDGLGDAVVQPVPDRGAAAVDPVVDPVDPTGHGTVHLAHGADDQVLDVVGRQRGGVQGARVVPSHSEQVFTELASGSTTRAGQDCVVLVSSSSALSALAPRRLAR